MLVPSRRVVHHAEHQQVGTGGPTGRRIDGHGERVALFQLHARRRLARDVGAVLRGEQSVPLGTGQRQLGIPLAHSFREALQPALIRVIPIEAAPTLVRADGTHTRDARNLLLEGERDTVVRGVGEARVDIEAIRARPVDHDLIHALHADHQAEQGERDRDREQRQHAFSGFAPERRPDEWQVLQVLVLVSPMQMSIAGPAQNVGGKRSRESAKARRR